MRNRKGNNTLQNESINKLQITIAEEEQVYMWEQQQLPIGPDDVLKKFNKHLTEYEKKEIL